LNEVSRSLMFEANVDNSNGVMRAGLFAEAELVLDPGARALVVPSTAIVQFAGVEKVWKVVEGVSSEQPVQTGRRSQDRVEITRGLAAGDVILLQGSQGRVARIATSSKQQQLGMDDGPAKTVAPSANPANPANPPADAAARDARTTTAAGS
jgi:hypothetical protein